MPRRPSSRRRGPARRRQLRPHHQQHHLRRDGRRDELLGLLPGRGRLGADAGLGLRRRDRQRGRRRARGHAGLRLPAAGLPPGRPAGPGRATRLRRRHPASGRSCRPPTTATSGSRRLPLYEEDNEDQQMLLWPLYFTSFLIDDFLDDEGFFGAKAAVLSSASSRTSSALAYLLDRAGRDRGGRAHLTAERRVHRVARRLRPRRPLRGARLARSRAGRLRRHVGRRKGPKCRPRPLGRRAQALRRGRDHPPRGPRRRRGTGRPEAGLLLRARPAAQAHGGLGREGVNERLAETWRQYVDWARGWLRVEHGSGPEDVERIYRELLDGKSDPAVGHVLSP